MRVRHRYGAHCPSICAASLVMIAAGGLAGIGMRAQAPRESLEDRVTRIESWIKAEDGRRERGSLEVLRSIGRVAMKYASERRDAIPIDMPELYTMRPAVFVSPFGPAENDDYALMKTWNTKFAGIQFPAQCVLAFDRAALLLTRDTIPVLLADGSSWLLPLRTFRTIEALRNLGVAAKNKMKVEWSEDAEAALKSCSPELVTAAKLAASSGNWEGAGRVIGCCQGAEASLLLSVLKRK